MLENTNVFDPETYPELDTVCTPLFRTPELEMAISRAKLWQILSAKHAQRSHKG